MSWQSTGTPLCGAPEIIVCTCHSSQHGLDTTVTGGESRWAGDYLAGIG
ncbi:MAG: hypothetical protein NTZ78_10420 [Candidatus Aureabacteria bacterium]|nr:hypothetical protein [Candidatus Auribacterota bacterium]